MTGVALKGLRARKLRSALTAFAIVLGVAMVSGSFVLTDTIGRSFDSIFGESYDGSDAVISSKQAIDADDDGAAPPFSAEVLDAVRRLPGVAAASGSIEDEASLVDGGGKIIGGGGEEGLALAVGSPGDGRFNPLDLVAGTWPRGSTEIAIDKGTAEDENLGVGDHIGAIAEGPVRRYRISGIVQYGSVDSLGGLTISVFDLPTARTLFGKHGKFDRIRVVAVDGISPAVLAAEIRRLLPETAQVRTASEQAASESEESQADLGFLRTLLLGFGGVALLVGALVIANTLSITVAQRMRELATLRTLGASRPQVLVSVVLEALVVGVLASVAGLFAGLGLAKGLDSLLASTGLDLPQQGLVFATRTIVVSIVLGTAIAVVASLRPALRATRVPPIAAIREGAALPQSRLARFGVLPAAVVLAGAVTLACCGVFASGLATGLRLLAVGAGILLLFGGVAMVAPRLVRPLAAILGAPGARLGGAPGMLARDNATRNPGRTASTAAALMIGLALVTFVAVLAQGLRTSFSDAVDELFIADYAVSSQAGTLDAAAAAAVAGSARVPVVSSIREGRGEAFGSTVTVNGVDEHLGDVVGMRWEEGSGDVAARLGRNGAFVKPDYADAHELAVGSPLRLETPTGAVLSLVVKGIFAEPKGGSPFGEIGISRAAFDASYAEHENAFTLVNMEGGVSAESTAELERSLVAFPDADVETRDEFKQGQIRELDAFLNLLYVLLGLSVIVSLFGIVNTLVLSVFERTRELGMLRAIGMTRRQVRRMIRHESIVTALIGASLGIAIGILLAALVTRTLSDEGIVFAVPYGSLAVFALAAVAAGMLAAILPARRASRLNVLGALQYE